MVWINRNLVLATGTPNPMVTLNRSVAVGRVRGPQAGLDLLRTLDHDERIAEHHRLDVIDGAFMGPVDAIGGNQRQFD